VNAEDTAADFGTDDGFMSASLDRTRRIGVGTNPRAIAKTSAYIDK